MFTLSCSSPSACISCNAREVLYLEYRMHTDCNTDVGCQHHVVIVVAIYLHLIFDAQRWDYVNFGMYLNLKDPSEMTGVESAVWARLQLGAIDWLPAGQVYRSVDIV